jgi:predicted RNA-binding protein YlqC (UPF0109 family)
MTSENENDMMKRVDPSPEVDLLRRLLSRMVAYPETLVLDAKAFYGSATISIQAHAADTPRLIGTGCVNYRSIRAIMLAVCARRGYSVTVPKIREPVTGVPEQYKFTANPRWPSTELLALLTDTVRGCVEQPESVRLEPHHDDENVTTTVEVFVSRTENKDVLRALGPAIKTVFDAIGRTNGRLLNVALIPDAEPSQEQPASARGRYTGEVER